METQLQNICKVEFKNFKEEVKKFDTNYYYLIRSDSFCLKNFPFAWQINIYLLKDEKNKKNEDCNFWLGFRRAKGNYNEEENRFLANLRLFVIEKLTGHKLEIYHNSINNDGAAVEVLRDTLLQNLDENESLVIYCKMYNTIV